MMMRMFVGSKVVCLAAALVAASGVLGQTPAPAGNAIHVEISGLRNDKGQMLCALFSSAEAFPKKADKAVARLTAKIADRQAVCDFAGVAPGTYGGVGRARRKLEWQAGHEFNRNAARGSWGVE
jgi:uncharacterized protein (DUF2141 family)